MSLANVGLKSCTPGVNISGAVQLMEFLDMEKTSNMIAFSPKSARRARGCLSLLIKTLAWSIFRTVCVSPGMVSTHSSNIAVYLVDLVEVPQSVGYVDQLRHKVNANFWTGRYGTDQAHPIYFWMFPSVLKNISILHPGRDHAEWNGGQRETVDGKHVCMMEAGPQENFPAESLNRGRPKCQQSE